jgi:hypothetical protein
MIQLELKPKEIIDAEENLPYFEYMTVRQGQEEPHHE